MTEIALQSSPDRSPGAGLWLAISRHTRELSVAAAYGLILALLAWTHPTFFQNQFLAVCVSASPVLVAAVGMTLVILAREIDISIGSQFAVSAVIAGLLAQRGWPMAAVVGVTLIGGAAMGAFNGLLVTRLGLPSIVVTLATLVIYRQSLLWITGGRHLNSLPPTFHWLGLEQSAGQRALIATALVVLAIFTYLMGYVPAGRAVYAVGSDQEAARLAGIGPRRVVMGVFVVLGVLTALASLLSAVRFIDVDPHVGMGWELTVIAAVVVGGTAISGGRGSLFGTLLGVMLLATIVPALAFLRVPPQWERAVQGLIILLAVASDSVYRRVE